MANINPDIICPHLQKQIDELKVKCDVLFEMVKGQAKVEIPKFLRGGKKKSKG